MLIPALIVIVMAVPLAVALRRILSPQPVENLGNFLIQFCISWVTGKPTQRPRYWVDRGRKQLDAELIHFYRELPYDFLPDRDFSEFQVDCEPRSCWEPFRCGADYVAIWEALGPSAKEVLDRTLRKVNCVRSQKYPVIHFRCSDCPFVLNEVYHFPYYDYYEWAIDKLRSRNVDCSEVLILASHQHRSASANRQSCRKYVRGLSEFLNEMGIQTRSQCGTTLEDFSTMFYAPGLIGGASSYSFSAGVGKISEGTFCCPRFGLEEKGNFYSLVYCPGSSRC